MKLLPKVATLAFAAVSSINVAYAEGSSGVGTVDSLSHEILGTYVQLMDGDGNLITVNPSNCSTNGKYFLPTQHPNYDTLSSSLLTAQATKQPLSLLLSGCHEDSNKISFVRFGNWTGVNTGSPTTYEVTSSGSSGSSSNGGGGSISVVTNFPTLNDTCSTGDRVFATNSGATFICGGQDSLGFKWYNMVSGERIMLGNAPFNLVHYLSFDSETILGSTITDLSPAGADQTKENGVLIPGQFGDGIDLSLSTAKLNLDSSVSALTAANTDHTISVWVKTKVETNYDSGAHQANVISNTGPITRAMLYSNTDTQSSRRNKFVVNNFNSNSYFNWDLGEEIQNDTWYNIIMSWDAANYTLKVFLNGKYVGSQYISHGNARTSSGVNLGGWVVSAYYSMNGIYDELKIYDGFINDASHGYAEAIAANSF